MKFSDEVKIKRRERSKQLKKLLPFIKTFGTNPAKTITNETLENIEELSNYTCFRIYPSEISKKKYPLIVKAIQGIPLTGLILQGEWFLSLSCEKKTDELSSYIIKSLATNTTLKYLSISVCSISERVCKNIADVFANHPSLFYLEIQSRHIEKGGCGHIAKIIRSNQVLLYLAFRKNATPERECAHILEAVEKSPSLLCFDFGSNFTLTVDSCESLSNTLKGNTHLARLELYFDEISVDGCSLLAEGLTKNTTLLHLYLLDNKIGPINSKALLFGTRQYSPPNCLEVNQKLMGSLGCTCISSPQYGCYLSYINLSGNEIGEEGCNQVAEVLKYNHFLKDLDLSDNNIESKGCIRLADALNTNHTLRRLNLSGNDIGEEGCNQVAEVLKYNHFLIELELSSNNIGSKGCIRLANALNTNRTLLRLNFSNNDIGDEGCNHFAEVLKVNHTLVDLVLFLNGIRDEGCLSLIHALEHNTAVETLKVGEGETLDISKQFTRLLLRNNSLLYLSPYIESSPCIKHLLEMNNQLKKQKTLNIWCSLLVIKEFKKNKHLYRPDQSSPLFTLISCIPKFIFVKIFNLLGSLDHSKEKYESLVKMGFEEDPDFPDSTFFSFESKKRKRDD